MVLAGRFACRGRLGGGVPARRRRVPDRLQRSRDLAARGRSGARRPRSRHAAAQARRRAAEGGAADRRGAARGVATATRRLYATIEPGDGRPLHRPRDAVACDVAAAPSRCDAVVPRAAGRGLLSADRRARRLERPVLHDLPVQADDALPRQARAGSCPLREAHRAPAARRFKRCVQRAAHARRRGHRTADGALAGPRPRGGARASAGVVPLAES